LLAGSGEECLEMLRHKSPDVVLLDIWLPGIDGLETLEKLVEPEDHPEVIMISGHGNIETAVRATKLGAFDFLEKPLSIERTLIVLKNAIEAKRLRSENLDLKKQFQARSVIVGDSIPIKALRQQIALMAPTNGRVLIYGESGTGKELVARAIHYRGLLSKKPFVAVDCGSLVPTLIESELFGYEKGAFTGALRSKEGLFQSANGGTIFLDEIGELSPELQAKLLRVLQEKEVRPVGSNQKVKVDVRVIAATNRDLEAAQKEGAFRKDLYFRLNVVTLNLPPLRERRSDVAPLVHYFLDRFAPGKNISISPAATKTMFQYDWPGNVRELENCIERAVALGDQEMIDVSDLPPAVSRQQVQNVSVETEIFADEAAGSSNTDLEELERETIQRVFEQVHGDKARARKMLGISRATLYRKLKRYNIGMAKAASASP
jgi:DNA-binding NtrC family response regulator